MSFAESSKAIFLSKISMASGPELVPLDNCRNNSLKLFTFPRIYRGEINTALF
tara:strand:+ start:1975 stop:2133 length:159 start_codon:yes stop_codon:yes gene_type:complete